MPNSVWTSQNAPAELAFAATSHTDDRFAELELWATFTAPDGSERRVPGFWCGERDWRLRYASPHVGAHTFVTESDDPGLNGRRGVVTVEPYEGSNPLLRHGPVRVGASGCHFEHADGTPFFWLADTWWLMFVARLGWPDDFKRLVADRVTKRFSVIQLVAGLYPEMEPFDDAGRGPAGWPWSPGFERINPMWFDEADLRIGWLIRSGLMPCVVGAWGCYLQFAGSETMKRHWRYLVARYGAYPLVWCVAGEANLPFRASGSDKERLSAEQKAGWTEVAEHLRRFDPFERLVTVHPSPDDGSYSSYDVFDAPELFDFDMLQTGHADKQSMNKTLEELQRALARSPRKPVINSETCYEGIAGASWHDTQRLIFWTHILSGAAGHTYGASGLWGFSTAEAPFAGSAGAWSEHTWEEAYRFPGSRQLGIAKDFFTRFDWQRFEPHPEWIDPHWTQADRLLPYAAGIPGEVRVVYLPSLAVLAAPIAISRALAKLTIRRLEPGVSYRAHYFNPRTGKDLEPMDVTPSPEGDWVVGRAGISPAPSMEDWVLVLQRC